jgi:hypothetical protein
LLAVEQRLGRTGSWLPKAKNYFKKYHAAYTGMLGLGRFEFAGAGASTLHTLLPAAAADAPVDGQAETMHAGWRRFFEYDVKPQEEEESAADDDDDDDDDSDDDDEDESEIESSDSNDGDDDDGAVDEVCMTVEA